MIALLALSALASPPDSTLSGDTGTLEWSTSERDGALRVVGRAGGWDVRHTSTPELQPIRTVRTFGDGTVVAFEYRPDGVDVRLGLDVIAVDAADLWDGDVLPYRLGGEVLTGNTDLAFQIVDHKGKLRDVTVRKVADETCGDAGCTHLQVKGKGVDGHYWYAGDGTLRRTSNRDGDFSAF